MSNKILQEFLYPEVFAKCHDVKHDHVLSEKPDDHWSLLPVQNEIVLDLGCGLHMNPSESTPEYFIKKQAKGIVGVDPDRDSIRILKELWPKHYFYCDIIDSSDKIDHYINTTKASCLKMDIEGDEIHFINSNSDFSNLKHVAIESHSKELLNSLVKKLHKLNFYINTICTFYPRVYNTCNLIYASR
jgi:hypothetical protein